MTHEDRIEFCKNCLNKSFDFKRGTFCSLTNNLPNFDTSCDSFEPDVERAKSVIIGRKIALKADKEESKMLIKYSSLSLTLGIISIPIFNGALTSWIGILVSTIFLAWGISRRLIHGKGDEQFLTKKD